MDRMHLATTFQKELVYFCNKDEQDNVQDLCLYGLGNDERRIVLLLKAVLEKKERGYRLTS